MPHSAFEDLRRTVEAALAVEDATAALAALRPVARAVAAEHGAEFRTLIANIPDAAWRADAEIASAMGASYRAAGSPRGSSAIGYFRAADAALAARNQDADPDRVRVWLGHAAALRSLGQLESAQRLGKRARTLDVPDGIHSIFSTHVGLGARCALEMGMLDLHLGDLDAARRKLEYANGLAAEHLIRAERIEVLGGLALIDFARSALETASRYIAQARALAAGTELWTTGYAAPALVAETLVAVERHDLEGAAEIESAMLDAAGNSDWEPFSYIAASYQRLASRQLAEGLDLLQRARDGFRAWSPAGVGLSLEELFRASLLVELDQGEEAWSILRDLPRYEHRVLCPAPITAQLRLGNGDLRGAGDALEECEQHPDNHSPRTIVEIQMLRAAIEFEKGEIRFADVMFDRALVTIARTGSRAPLRLVPPGTLAGLTARALTRDHAAEAVRILHRIAEETVGHTRLIEPLSQRELLVLAEVVNGSTVAGIAAALYISPNTVKTHLRRLYKKLGVTTRADAIRKARSLGLGSAVTRDSPA